MACTKTRWRGQIWPTGHNLVNPWLKRGTWETPTKSHSISSLVWEIFSSPSGPVAGLLLQELNEWVSPNPTHCLHIHPSLLDTRVFGILSASNTFPSYVPRSPSAPPDTHRSPGSGGRNTLTPATAGRAESPSSGKWLPSFNSWERANFLCASF